MPHRMQSRAVGCGKHFRRNQHKIFITFRGIFSSFVVFNIGMDKCASYAPKYVNFDAIGRKNAIFGEICMILDGRIGEQT